ncbi:hypothetical protein ACHAQH_006283 [Verticillium albo-atrum]
MRWIPGAERLLVSGTTLAARPSPPRSWLGHSRPHNHRHSYSSQSKTESIIYDADVIVVGAGIAGVSASIAAAEKGARVILLDAAHGGGASAQSGGVVYAGGGTEQQKTAGYGDDTPENMFEYLKQEVAGTVDDETLWTFCAGSATRLQWMERHGAKFQASLCPWKTSYPTDRHYLYFSGNEKSYPYNTFARPAPRGHRMLSPGMSGNALWTAMFRSVQEAGIRVMPASRVESLVVSDKDHRITGVALQQIRRGSKAFKRHESLTRRGQKFQLLVPELADVFLDRADIVWKKSATASSLSAPAIILAAGGFAFNPAMREKYLPEFSQVAPLGTRGDDGSGIRLGQSVGGATGSMNSMSAWRFLYPSTAFLEGVIVSREGRRFITEDIYGATLTDHMIRYHGNLAFAIYDSTQWAKAKAQLGEQTQSPLKLQRLHTLFWGYKKASTLEGLAAKFGIAPGALAQTIDAYNQAIAHGETDQMHKSPEYCSPVRNGPFYGIDISATPRGSQVVSGLTLGGLCVDGKTGLVLREDGSTIDGLYAAGRTAVGVCSNSYISGLSIADGVFSATAPLPPASRIRVALNPTSVRALEDNDFELWSVADEAAPSKTIGSVKLSLQIPSGAKWRGGWYKYGYSKFLSSMGERLVSQDMSTEAGGSSISLSITGLAAGTHTLLAWHNAWDKLSAVAALTVAVNGAPAATNVAQAVRVDNIWEAATSHVSFSDLDQPDVTSPAHRDERVALANGAVVASWRAPATAASPRYDVYLGTSNTTLRNVSLGQTTAGLNTLSTYYWSVDVVSGGTIHIGQVFMFRGAQLAFPGAEGWGRFSRGGRGGKVVKVTSLADNTNPGTLRHALTVETDPRILCMPFGLSGASDVFLQHIRVRPGKVSGQTVDGMGAEGSNHYIYDRCSIGWSIDKAFSSRSAYNITFRRNMISEPLNVAGHQ